ncbi:MAG: hypothetical protein NTZ35_09625 [Ignavibacteriales bacterium]|nr:hypothetical protein [Ignavibacteriales bacterium]
MSLRVLLAVAVSFILISASFSLPRFASRTNLPCQSCHINPSGGGMRSTFGANFGRDDISVKAWQDEYALEDFSTKLNNFISYGADFRFLGFYESKTSPDVSSSSFFPMQMDVYFNLAVSKKISLYVNPAFGSYNRLEMFAIAKVLPLNGYLKLGRFAPSHGLRYDDHTSFIRQATPFRNYGGQQSGVELALNPGPITIMGAVTNGMRGDLDGALPKAVFGKIEGHGALGPVNLMAGISSYNDASGGQNLNLLEGYGAVTISERLTVMGTAEQIQGNSATMSLSSDLNQRNSLNSDLKQFAVMVEADYVLVQGFDLKFMYDFFDPNTDVKSGTAQRYSGGFEFMPMGGVEVRPMYRYTKDSILNRNTTDLQVLFHIYL